MGRLRQPIIVVCKTEKNIKNPLAERGRTRYILPLLYGSVLNSSAAGDCPCPPDLMLVSHLLV